MKSLILLTIDLKFNKVSANTYTWEYLQSSLKSPTKLHFFVVTNCCKMWSWRKTARYWQFSWLLPSSVPVETFCDYYERSVYALVTFVLKVFRSFQSVIDCYIELAHCALKKLIEFNSL